jgi:hypothetical protein
MEDYLLYINLKIRMKFLLVCLLLTLISCDRSISVENCESLNVPNCKWCYPDECGGCNPGYKLVDGQCVTYDCSSISNCGLCQLHGVKLECLKCNFGYQYANSQCQQIACISGCAQCGDSSTCTLCKQGYNLEGTTCVASSWFRNNIFKNPFSKTHFKTSPIILVAEKKNDWFRS